MVINGDFMIADVDLMVNVWKIYLQNWVICEINVVKNSIHGAYGL